MKTIFLSFFIIAHYGLSAQVYFNNTYDYNNSNDGFLQVDRIGNDKMFAVGQSFESNGFNYALFSLLSDTGDTLWSKRYHYTTPDYGGVVSFYFIQMDDETIVANGFMADTSEGATDIFLQAFNTQGDSLWFQNLDAGYNDRASKILADKDGGLLVLGYYYLGDSDSSRILIIKTDSLGNKLWQREYGQPDSYNFAYEIYETDDGGYILAGERNDNNNQNVNLLLLKLDSTFNQEWAKSYDAGFLEFSGGFSALLVTDDGYIIAGQQEYFAVSTGTHRSRGIIIKTDKNGNSLWQKLVGYPFNDIGFKGIVEAEENTYMLLGVTSIDSGSNGMARAVLYKMDSLRNIFWQREYSYYNGSALDHVYPSMISRLENGDYLVSGYVLYLSQAHSNDAWLMRTDSCGYTEGDVSIAQIQLDTLIAQTITLQNTSPAYCSWQWQFGDGDSSALRNPTHTYSDTGSYTITLITRTGNDWDTAFLQVHVGDTLTDVSQQSSDVSAEMKLYPNPASEYIILSGYIPENETGARIEFYDMQGRVVKTEFLKNGLINQGVSTKPFAKGVYAYRVYSNQANIATGKIFIEP